MAKILFTTTLGSASWAGSEVLWFSAAKLLREAGHWVSTLLPMNMRTSENVERCAAAEITIVSGSLDRARFVTARLQHRFKPIRPSFQSPVVAWARRHQPDLVVFSQASCWGAYSDMLALSVLGIKYCCVSQLNTPFSWLGDALFEVVGEAFAKAEACVFVSQGNLSLFENQTARSYENAKVISNLPSFEIEKPCGSPPVDVFRLLNVARIDPAHKGQDLLLDVLALPKWRGRNIEVEIAGGGATKWFERAATSKGLTNIKLLGHVSDLQSAWERATFGVFPSRYEGMPLAIIEGMAFGRAVIATDVAGHAEWIECGENGFLAAGCNVRALDAALESAWERRAEAGAMGQIAATDVKSRLESSPAKELCDLINVFSTSDSSISAPS